MLVLHHPCWSGRRVRHKSMAKTGRGSRAQDYARVVHVGARWRSGASHGRSGPGRMWAALLYPPGPQPISEAISRPVWGSERYQAAVHEMGAAWPARWPPRWPRCHPGLGTALCERRTNAETTHLRVLLAVGDVPHAVSEVAPQELLSLRAPRSRNRSQLRPRLSGLSEAVPAGLGQGAPLLGSTAAPLAAARLTRRSAATVA